MKVDNTVNTFDTCETGEILKLVNIRGIDNKSRAVVLFRKFSGKLGP